jgi:hypothetical protein
MIELPRGYTVNPLTNPPDPGITGPATPPPSDTGFLVPEAIRKEVISLAISNELLADAAWRPRTREEQATHERQRQAALDAMTQAHAQLLADRFTDDLAIAVLTLHAPQVHGYLVTCDGCDFAGYEGEPPEWPCRTYRLAAEHSGRQFVGEYEAYGPRMVTRP